VNGADKGTMENGKYTHPNGTPVGDVFLWANALVPGKNVVAVSDGQGHGDTMTVYLRGTGMLAADGAGKIARLSASKGEAVFIDTAARAQWPFYLDLDGTADNTFDELPAAVGGAGWIATGRQSDPARTAALSFDVTAAAELFVMFTKQATPPAWLAAGGFSDTGVSGVWRDNDLARVPYALWKRTAKAGEHVALAATAMDYVVLVK
jgi:hypothetical protein